MGFDYAHHSCQSATRNMHSAREHAQVIREYLAVECSEGRVVGPLCPPWSQTIQISRFGVIPKGATGKWRLILDLSSPEGASVNCGIDKELCSLKYATVDQATESVVRLGRGTLMAKIDIKAAYRLVPVHPEDRWLLGMQFEGADFMDTVLPFGMRSAPKIFNAVADALEWVCRNEGVQEALHYLDDFMVFGAPDSSECSDYLLILRSVFWRLGVPIAEHKTAGPSSKITFLGVEIDSQQLTLRLPEEKLTELRALVSSWLYKKVAVARDLKSVVGKLENACKVVRPGRSFLRRMLDLLRGVHSNRRLIRLSEAFRSDLMWWHTFLEVWNGVSMIPFGDPQLADVVVHTDASGNLGCAAWWPDGWLQYSWPPEMVETHITPKEALPIVLACAVWGEEWNNKKIHVYCDNEAAAISLNAGSSKDTWTMHLIRCLFFIKANFGLRLTISHIPGKDNKLADALSRNDFAYFHTQVPAARRYNIPPQLESVLVTTRPDWTSVNWAQLFSNCFRRV